MASPPAYYPLTFEQESIWIDEHLHDVPARYLESWAYRLAGSIDARALEAALAGVVRRHHALRSGIDIVDGELAQIVHPVPRALLTQADCDPADLDDELRRIITTPLDLTKSPMRGHLLQLGRGDAVLVVQLHHIVIDDWALHVLDHDFAECYRAHAERRPPDLPPLPLQLGPYALAQREAGINPDVLGYWIECLRNAPRPSTIPGDRPRPAEPSSLGAEVRYQIDPALAGRVRALSRKLRTTPFSVLACAVATLLAAVTGAEDLLVGAPVSRRGAADLDQLIGCVTDLLPLRITAPPGCSFADLVGSAKTVVNGAIAHADISYAELVRRVLTRKERGAEPLCRTVLVVDDTGPGSLELPGVSAERLHIHTGMAKFDLCFTLTGDAGGYQGFLEYATDLFDAGTARHIADCFCQLLDLVTRQPGRAVADFAAAVAQAWRDGPSAALPAAP